MNIIVLAKQVPNTTEMKVNKETGTLIRDGIETIINPDDLAGIEAALRIKEKNGAKVTVVTMGPNNAESMLRETYGLGVDDTILVTDKAFAGSDTLATSKILAEAIKNLDYDLIIAGRQAIDGDTAQVGPQIAELLSLPQVSYVEEITDIEEGFITVIKSTETHSFELNVRMPALITTLSELNTARYMNVKDVWESYDKEVKKVDNSDLKLNKEEIGLKGSPTRVKKTFIKAITKKSEKQILDAAKAADVIVEALNPHL